VPVNVKRISNKKGIFMDPITRKLVETVKHILNEGAARGGAAIFADMDEKSFQSYIDGNPGAADLAKRLRAQGRAARGQPVERQTTQPQQTQPQPARPQNTESTYTPYTVSAPEHESEKIFTEMVDAWTKAKQTNPEGIDDYNIRVIQHRAGKTKDAALHEKLINHPEAEMRSWALRNPLTTSEHINKLLKDPDEMIQWDAVTSKAFSADNMKTLFDNSLSQINKNIKDYPRHHYQLIKRAIFEHPHLYTSDMHETLLNHKDSNIRGLANNWVRRFGKSPDRNDSY
jgi:hypothetical protein